MKCSSTGKEWYCLSNLDTDKLHLKDPNADTAIVDKDIDTMASEGKAKTWDGIGIESNSNPAFRP